MSDQYTTPTQPVVPAQWSPSTVAQPPEVQLEAPKPPRSYLGVAVIAGTVAFALFIAAVVLTAAWRSETNKYDAKAAALVASQKQVASVKADLAAANAQVIDLTGQVSSLTSRASSSEADANAAHARVHRLQQCLEGMTNATQDILDENYSSAISEMESIKGVCEGALADIDSTGV